MGDTCRWPINRLRFKDPIVAGMDVYTLLGMVPLLRKTAGHHGPIDIRDTCPTCGTATVYEGRHRWIANVIAGRHDVLTEPQE